MSQSVVLVGGWPPPAGGNSIHTRRLGLRLFADGKKVTVVDPYAARVFQLPEPALSGLKSGVRLARAKLLVRLWGAARGSIVHVHAAAGANFYKWGGALVAATTGARKRVVTLHSGDWVRRFRELPQVRRQLAVTTLSGFSDIICVNRHQIDELEGMVQSRLHLVPAFLPEAPAPEAAMPGAVARLRKEVDFLLVTSGYGTATYDYETVLGAAERAQARIRARLGVVVATYASWDREYWSAVEMRYRASSIPTVITEGLDASVFLRVLSSGDLYVRATISDGDAVAIREAGALGVPVAASRVVQRPSGVALFSAHDVEELATIIEEATAGSNIGKLNDPEAFDGYRKIVAIYDAGR